MEQSYLLLVQAFLDGHTSVDDFVRDFMSQWREDRDEGWVLTECLSSSTVHSDEFSAAVDQAFAACDCFSHEPINGFQISEAQLRIELHGLVGKTL